MCERERERQTERQREVEACPFVVGVIFCEKKLTFKQNEKEELGAWASHPGYFFS